MVSQARSRTAASGLAAWSSTLCRVSGSDPGAPPICVSRSMRIHHASSSAGGEAPASPWTAPRFLSLAALPRIEYGERPMGHMDYVIRGGVQGRERLRILARVLQPFTQSLLERSGLARGMSCLDAGCGGGDVTFEIARMVGPRARVVGLDADPTKIAIARGEAADLDLPGVEFCVAEVGGSLPEERFDF